MGYHVDVYNGLANLIIAAVPSSTPVFNALAVSEREFVNYASSVCILRESIGYEPHPEISPRTAVADQVETWNWTLYVTGGAGAARPAGAGAEVDKILEIIRTALNAQRPTSDCGPMHLVSEDLEDSNGTLVTYAQRWTHRRL